MSVTQNEKIRQVTETTMVIGVCRFVNDVLHIREGSKDL